MSRPADDRDDETGTGSAGRPPGTPEPEAAGDVSVRLDWDDGLRFRARAGERVAELDGDADLAASPVEALLQSVGGCAAVDMVHILQKGREPLRGLQVRVSGDRADDHPRRLTRLRVHFRVAGDVDRDAAERAARLSFETYCSCYHSLREDIDLEYSVEVREE